MPNTKPAKTPNRISAALSWRVMALSGITTLASALICGWYLCDEYPWETHQRVLSERNAGKMLITAWPQLSAQERAKILNPTITKHHG